MITKTIARTVVIGGLATAAALGTVGVAAAAAPGSYSHGLTASASGQIGTAGVSPDTREGGVQPNGTRINLTTPDNRECGVQPNGVRIW